MRAFADALLAWSLCSFTPVALPALRCLAVLSSVAPAIVLSRLIVPGTSDQDEEKSNPPSCQPFSSFLEAVDSIVKRDPDAALATLSMQLLVNVIPACRFVSSGMLHIVRFFYQALFESIFSIDEAVLILETYLRRKQASFIFAFRQLSISSFIILQFRHLRRTPHKWLTVPGIPSAFSATSGSGKYYELTSPDETGA